MKNIVTQNIENAMHAKGMEAAELSRRAGLDPSYVSKLLSGKIGKPGVDALAAIAGVLGLTVAALTGEADSHLRGDVRLAPHAPFNPFDLPKDVPVLGTAAGSHTKGAFQLSGGAIDYVRRPPGLMGARDVYGLYIEGSSMEPQFFPGDLVYVHPHRPPRIGDPVVVQSKYRSDEEIEATIGVYRRATEKHVVIQKWNPAAEVEILRNGATIIHRIVRNNELLGI